MLCDEKSGVEFFFYILCGKFHMQSTVLQKHAHMYVFLTSLIMVRF